MSDATPTSNQHRSKLDPGTCAFCGEPTDNLAGNPGMWSLMFTHPDGTGYARDHHVKCVQDRLFRSTVETTVKCGCGVTLERRLFCPACREAMPFDFASAAKASVDPRNCPQCGPHPNESSDEHTQRRHTFSGLFGESEENGRP